MRIWLTDVPNNSRVVNPSEMLVLVYIISTSVTVSLCVTQLGDNLTVLNFLVTLYCTLRGPGIGW